MGNLDLQSTITLSDGHKMPRFGLGVYESEGEDCYQSCMWALEHGYRLIDSAEWYENEAESGRAINDFIKKTGVSRSEIYYTTKLKTNSTYEHCTAKIQESLKLAGLDYIDLYLIHGPHPDKTARLETWRAIEDAIKAGYIRSAGVSNFGIRHLQELKEVQTLPVTINQIDLHPFMTRTELVEFCKKENIVMTAWGPLVRGQRFDHPAVKAIAEKHGKTSAHVLLRWGLQHDYVIIPKSVKKDRIIANAQIYDFVLSEEEIKQLDALDEHLVTDWDPSEDP